MSEPVRHIVFDIGKVLIHYDPELAFSRAIPDSARRRWFFENVCTPEWNIEQDRGRPWAEAEALLIERFPEEEENIRGFRRNWQEMVPHAHDDTVAIMERLIDGGHDVTMLTNFAADTLAEARTRFGFLGRPRGVTVSGEVRLIKPQREIYEHHVREFGLAPAHTLFIDDSATNVRGAIDAGWQAVQFVDASTLTRDLSARGIAVA